MKQPVLAYSTVSKLLHWVVAFLVIMMLSLSFFLDDVPKENQDFAFMIHKSVGLTILLLMLIRLVWIIKKGRPPLPYTIAPWERHLALFVEYSFYVFLIVMPLTGWIMSVAADRVPTFFDLFNVPFYGIPVSKPLAHLIKQIHNNLAWVIIAFIVLHIAGALKHHFVDKDTVLDRMM